MNCWIIVGNLHQYLFFCNVPHKVRVWHHSSIQIDVLIFV
jgi:hypothetical protein